MSVQTLGVTVMVNISILAIPRLASGVASVEDVAVCFTSSSYFVIHGGGNRLTIEIMTYFTDSRQMLSSNALATP
jgi:hypothetical protein